MGRRRRREGRAMGVERRVRRGRERRGRERREGVAIDWAKRGGGGRERGEGRGMERVGGSRVRRQ